MLCDLLQYLHNFLFIHFIFYKDSRSKNNNKIQKMIYTNIESELINFFFTDFDDFENKTYIYIYVYMKS